MMNKYCYGSLFLLISALSSFSVSAAPPTFAMALSSTTIGPGSVSTVTYTIDNSNEPTTVTGLTFSHTLPTGVMIANPSNALTSCINGSYTAAAAADNITFTDFRLGSGQTCTLTHDITSTTAGAHVIRTGTLSSSAGSVTESTVTLTVDGGRPGFTMAFSSATVSPGAVTTLTYTIDNSANGSDANLLTFSQTLPVGMRISDDPKAETSCTGGTITAVPGTNQIAMAGGSVDANATCTLSLDILAEDTGAYRLATGSLSQNSSNPSGIATASLNIINSFLSITFPSVVGPGTTVKMGFTLNNFDRNNSLTDITFTNDLNSTLSGLTATVVPANDFCGAGSTLTGTSTLTVAGAGLSSGESCSFEVTIKIPVTANAGSYTNTTSIINLTQGSATTKAAVSTTLEVKAAPLVTASFVDSPVTNGEDVTMRFSITNSDDANTASDISFLQPYSDVLGELVIKSLPDANSCGTGSTFTDHDNGVDHFIKVASAELTADANCTFDVILTIRADEAQGTFLLSPSLVSATVSGGMVYSTLQPDALTVVAAPSLSLSIVEDYTVRGSTVTAEFTLNFPENASADVTDLAFSVDLDASLSGLVSTTSTQNDVCGSGSSFGGSKTLTLSNASMSPDTSCSFSVTLQIPAEATASKITLNSSTVSGTIAAKSVSYVATSDFFTISGLTLTKTFSPDTALPGQNVTIAYTIANDSSALAATDISFTDELKFVVSGFYATSLPGVVCGSGSTINGSTSLSINGGTLQPGENCTFAVTALVPANATTGIYNSVTSEVSATINGNNTANPSASAVLRIEQVSVNLSTSQSSPTSDSPILVNINFDRNVVNFTSTDLTITKGTVTSFNGSEMAYTAQITPSGDGTVSIYLPANAVNDALDNAITNPESNTLSWQYTTEAATATPSMSISAPSISEASSGPVTYTVTYTDASEVNLTNGAIILNKNGTDATVNVTNGDTLTPTVTLSPISGEGSLGFSIAALTARNGVIEAAAFGPSTTFNVDTIRPTATITDEVSDVINTSFTARFTFREAVTGVSQSDISVVNGNLSQFVAKSTTVYEVLVSPISQGTVSLILAENIAIDSFSHGNETTDTHSLTYDTVGPDLTISKLTPQHTVINAPFTATFTFSEAVTGFDKQDISATFADVSEFSGSGQSYSAKITPTKEGLVSVDVAANVAIDVALNNNTVASQYSVTYDITAPTLEITSATKSVNGQFDATFTFNEDVSGFSADDIIVANGTVASFATTSARVYTATITPSGGVAITLDVAANAATDTATNNNLAASQLSVDWDVVLPTLTISTSSDEPVNQGVVVIFTFSEPVTNFDQKDILVTNATLSEFTTPASNIVSSSISIYTVKVTPTAQGEVTLSVAAGVAVDEAGNASSAGDGLTITYDSIQPSVLISGPVDGVNSAFTATFTFDEQVTEFVQGDISVTNAELTNFTLAADNSVQYTVTVTPIEQGNVSLNIREGVANDGAGNGNSAAVQFNLIYDIDSPTVSIDGPSQSQNTAFSATFTFNEDVTDFVINDISVVNGELTDFTATQNSAREYTVTVTPNEQGTVSLNVNADVAHDSAGNGSIAAEQFSISYDAIVPTLAIDGPSTPQNSAFSATFTFSEDVTGFEISDISAVNAELSELITVNNSASQYSVTVTPLSQGVITLDVDKDSAIDIANNGNAAADQFDVSYDNTDPTLTISGPDTSQNSAFSATFTFSEPVTGFEITDIVVVKAELSDFTAVNGSELEYSVTVTPTEQGTISLNVSQNAAFDSAGNANTAADQFDVSYDNIAPILTISGPDTPQNSGFSATFTFNEDVTDFVISDISVVNGELTDFTATQNSAREYTVTVTPSEQGTVSLNVNTDVAHDSAGNGSTAADQFSLIFDSVGPTVIIDGPNEPQNQAFSVTFTFTEDVTDFVQNDITVINADLADFTAVSGSAREYTVSVRPIEEGTVSVDISAEVAHDSATNGNAAALQFSQIYDITRPRLTISGPDNSQNKAFTASFTFSESVTGFVQSDITAVNGDLSGFAAVSNSTNEYTVLVTPLEHGNVSLAVSADVAIDSAGNNNELASQFSLIYDIVAPTVTIIGPVNDQNSSFSVTFSFSEHVNDFTVDDITSGNSELTDFAAVQGSDKEYTVTVTPSGQGTVSLNVAAARANDDAGNGNSAASEFRVFYDNVRPTLQISGPAGPESGPITALFTFSEHVNSFSLEGITVTNASLTEFTIITASEYQVTLLPDADGMVTLNVNSSSAVDAAGNINESAAQYEVVYDGTPPVAEFQGPAGRVNSDFVLDIVFSEDVTGLTLAALQADNGELSQFSSTTASAYTVTVKPQDDGEVSVTLGADQAIDIANNGNLAPAAFVVVFDSTAPGVEISGPSNGVTSEFIATVTFSSEVVGFTKTDIVPSNATLANLIEVATGVYEVKVRPINEGLVSLNIAQGSVVDLANNANVAAETFSVIYDVSRPHLNISGPDAVVVDAFTATFTFDEAVSGFEQSDVAVSNATISDFSVQSEQIYSALISPINIGVVTLNVAASAALDAVGNASLAQSYSVTYDIGAPTVVVSSPDRASGAFYTTIIFSKEVFGFELSDIAVSNATLDDFIADSATNYRVKVQALANGNVTIKINGNVAQDLQGKGNFASATVTTVFDNTSPTIVDRLPIDDKDMAAIGFDLSITFSENIFVQLGDHFVMQVFSTESETAIHSWQTHSDSFEVKDDKVSLKTPINLATGSYYVNISQGAFIDQTGNLFAGIDDNSSWNFSITNRAPVAVDDQVSLNEDNSIDIAVLTNDSDIDSTLDITSVQLVSEPINGSASVNTTTGIVSYVGHPNVSGEDSFSYTVNDTSGVKSNVATVTITVNELNDAPLAVDDIAQTNEEIQLVIDVLVNDSDIETTLDVTTVKVVNEPNKGTASVNMQTGEISYVPHPNLSGEDSFSYTVNDSTGLVSNIATVTMTINELNDAPSAADDTVQTNEEIEVVINVLGNDSDVDNALDSTSLLIETPVNNGVAQVANGLITYMPNSNYFGSDSFTYTVKDVSGAVSNVAIVTITVTNVIDPPLAVADAKGMDEDTQLVIDVLANDSDVDNALDNTTLLIGTAAANGLAQVADGMITYTPEDNFFGSDSFTYTVKNLDGAVSNDATVTITVTNVVDLPLAAADVGQTDEDTLLEIDLLANDEGLDNGLDLNTLEVVEQPQNGVIVMLGQGLARYTPTQNFFGNDSFSYTVADLDGNRSEPANVSLTVNSVNDAPVFSSTAPLNADPATTYLYSVVVTDVDDDEISVNATALPSWLTFDGDKTISGTPAIADIGQQFDVTITATDNNIDQPISQFFTVNVLTPGQTSLLLSQVASENPVLVGGLIEVVYSVLNQGPSNTLLDTMVIELTGSYGLLSVPALCGVSIINDNDVVTCPLMRELAVGDQVDITLTLPAIELNRGEIQSVVSITQQLSNEVLDNTMPIVVAQEIIDQEGEVLEASTTADSAFGDVNNDGLADLVRVNSGKSANDILFNVGNGEFAASQTFGEGSDSRAVILVDLDNDGNLDIVVANTGDTASGYYLNDGTGHFGDIVTLGKMRSTGVSSGDFNEDGLIDLVFGNAKEVGNKVFIQPFVASSTGQPKAVSTMFSGQLTSSLLTNASNIAMQKEQTETGDALAVNTGDFNGDGQADIVIGYESSGMQVLINDGNGAFNPLLIEALTDITFIAISDINDDAIDDIFISYPQGNAVILGQLSLDQQTFENVLQISENAAEEIGIADIDADQILDVMLVNNPGGITTYNYDENTEDPSQPFIRSDLVIATDGNDGMALADLDGDGDIDLIVTSEDETIPDEIMFNEGSGEFGAQTVDLSVSLTAPNAVTAEDTYGLTVAIANTGLGNARNVLLSLDIDSGELVSFDGAVLGCLLLSSNQMTCTLDELTHDTQQSMTINILATSSGTIEHNINISAENTDEDSENNQTSTSTQVTAKVIAQPPKIKSSGGSMALFWMFFVALILVSRHVNKQGRYLIR